MKLLGWMHRKLRQNTNETTPKDFLPIDDVLHCYQKGNHGTKAPFGKSQRGNNYYGRNSFEHEDEDDDDMMTDVFHGFLAIGTLGGTEQFGTTTTTAEPSTPTFSISEKETGQVITENELKLINDELEKVLGEDGRSSCCSAVTLSGKPSIEIADTCPLQSYLFGGVADTAPPPKKEARTSLGDLFQKTKHHEEDNFCGVNNTKNDKSAVVHVMKRMLKKTIKSSTPIDSDKKLHKILQMFNRKVHPENPTTAAACQKQKKSNVGSDHTEDIIIYPQQQAAADTSKDMIRCCKSQSLNAGNHEFWVKTDADYLVLEL